MGEEFIGVLFVENEKGRRSYIFELPILDVDLEGGIEAQAQRSRFVMAGLVPAIHVLRRSYEGRRRCPPQVGRDG